MITTPKPTEWGEGISEEDVLRKYDNRENWENEGAVLQKKFYIKKEYKTMIARDGENCIRIIQPFEWKQNRDWAIPVFYHYPVGPAKDYYLCLTKMRGQACPVCIARDSTWDEDRDLAKSMYPSYKQLMWVLDLMSDTPDQPLLYPCPKTLAVEISGQSKRKGTAGQTGVFSGPSNPRTGAPIFFDREGKGIQTKYVNVQYAADPMPLDESIMQLIDWFENVLDFPTFEMMQEAYDGHSGVLDGEQDGGGEPTGGPLYTRPEPEQLQEEVPPPECFGKEYDKYQDCDNCEVNNECSAAMEVPDPVPDPVPDSSLPTPPARVPKTAPKVAPKKVTRTAPARTPSPAKKTRVERVVAKPSLAAGAAGGGDADHKKVKEQLRASIEKRKKARG